MAKAPPVKVDESLFASERSINPFDSAYFSEDETTSLFQEETPPPPKSSRPPKTKTVPIMKQPSISPPKPSVSLSKPSEPPARCDCQAVTKHLEKCSSCQDRLQKVIDKVIGKRMSEMVESKPKKWEWKDIALIIMGIFIILIIIYLFVTAIVKSQTKSTK